MLREIIKNNISSCVFKTRNAECKVNAAKLKANKKRITSATDECIKGFFH